MKRTPLILLGLALGLGLVLWLQSREQTEPQAPPTGSGSNRTTMAGQQYEIVDVPTESTPGLTPQPAVAPDQPNPESTLEIVLLDPKGRPIAGQPVRCHPPRGKPRLRDDARLARTDQQGVARFPDLTPERVEEYDARHDAPVPASQRYRPWWVFRTSIQGWRTTARSEWGMPFRVQIVDGITGTPMPDVAWGTGWIRTEEAPGPPTLIGDTARAQPGESCRFGFHVHAPEGYVAWDATTIQSYVADAGRHLTAVYPLRKELAFEVTLVPKLGGSFEGDASFELRCVDQQWRSLRSKSLGAGRFRLHGVPFLPEEPYEIRAEGADLEGDVAGRLPATLGSTTSQTIEMYEEGEADFDFEGDNRNGAIGIGGTPGEIIRPEPKRGTLSVLCLLSDGRPAQNVRVSASGPEWKGTKNGHAVSGRYRLSGDTDAGGRIAWADAPAGEWRVQFRAWHRGQGIATVRAEQRTELTVREPHGGSLEIQVVTPDNHPLPFATVSVRHAEERHVAWRPLPGADGGVRVDAYTDHLGRRTLKRMFPGTHEVTVRFGSREKQASTTLEDRKTGTLEVILEAPK